MGSGWIKLCISDQTDCLIKLPLINLRPNQDAVDDADQRFLQPTKMQREHARTAADQLLSPAMPSAGARSELITSATRLKPAARAAALPSESAGPESSPVGINTYGHRLQARQGSPGLSGAKGYRSRDESSSAAAGGEQCSGRQDSTTAQLGAVRNGPALPISITQSTPRPLFGTWGSSQLQGPSPLAPRTGGGADVSSGLPGKQGQQHLGATPLAPTFESQGIA